MPVDLYFTVRWSASSTIQKSDGNGAGIQTLISSGMLGPTGIVADPVGGKFYWADWINETVSRANFDGSEVETIQSQPAIDQTPFLAVDPGAEKVYWTESNADRIRRSNFDGTGMEDLVTSGLGNAAGITLHTAAGKMYWADINANMIRRANIDGTGVETVVSGIASPVDVAIDPAAGKLYWSARSASKIQRADLDGMNLEDVVIGLDEPWGIDLDLVNGYIYWADMGSDKIQRATLAGSGLEDIIAFSGIIGSFDGPQDVAIVPLIGASTGVPEPASIVLTLAALVLALLRRGRATN